MDKEFILERKELLHNFLRHVAKYKFFVESYEFGIFANFSGDLLKKQAKILIKETPAQKLKKYQSICAIDLDKITPEQRQRCKMAIEKFNLFVNTCLQTVRANRKTHEELAIRRETENKNYKHLLVKLFEYEKTGLDYYAQVDFKTPLNERRLIYNDIDSKMLPEKQATEDYGNPYRVMYRWIVNEIQDLLAWKECYSAIHKIENTIKDLKEKVRDLREFHSSLSQGKTTLKGLWLKIIREEVTDMQVMEMVVNTEAEIEDWQKVLDYIQYYIPLVVIPRFKSDRGGQYFLFLTNFAKSHINSCDRNISQWENVLKCTQDIDEEMQEREDFAQD